jgi:4-hydroxy-tetrahydrodipicolinate synthase
MERTEARHDGPTQHARPFGAVLTAMITPLTSAGDVDPAAAARVAARLVSDGNDGVVLNGTTGESPTTHAPEKAAVVEAVVAAVGDRAHVVAGACSNDTAHAIRMAKDATAAGAHALLVVSPYYSRPSQEGLYRHVVAVTEATDLPVMVYDIPGRAGVRIAPDTWQRLAAHPQVVAAKDSTGDIASAARLIDATGLAWYTGDDSFLLPCLSVGGAGVVSVAAHVAGGPLREVVRRWDAGDHDGALKAFRRVAPVVEAINGAGFQAVMAKAAVEIAGVTDNRVLRLPYVAADDDDVAMLRDRLAAAGLLPSTTP